MNSSKGKISWKALVIGGLLAVVLGTAVLFPSLGIFGVGIWFYNKFQGAVSGFSSGGAAMVIPAEYAAVFNAAGTKWQVKPEFLAAIFVGEHRSIADSGYKTWPSINGPWKMSEDDAQGPFQFTPATWSSNKPATSADPQKSGRPPDIQNIWDSAFAAAHLFANMSPAANMGGNRTDLIHAQNAASTYISGKNLAYNQQCQTQDCKTAVTYVNRVIAAFNAFMASGNDIVTAAQKYLGKKYILGDMGPNSFDCSGLVTRALLDAGYKLSARVTTDNLPKLTTDFQKVNDLQPGDIMLFKGHMVIYMGRTGTGGAEQIIESSISGNVHISNKSAWVDRNMNIWLGNYRPIKK